ncbi:hypothetical protein PEWE109479_19570 [Pedobacter westerhofensis]
MIYSPVAAINVLSFAIGKHYFVMFAMHIFMPQ